MAAVREGAKHGIADIIPWLPCKCICTAYSMRHHCKRCLFIRFTSLLRLTLEISEHYVVNVRVTRAGVPSNSKPYSISQCSYEALCSRKPWLARPSKRRLLINICNQITLIVLLHNTESPREPAHSDIASIQSSIVISCREARPVCLPLVPCIPKVVWRSLDSHPFYGRTPPLLCNQSKDAGMQKWYLLGD